jgi:hypothetical protein
MDRRSEHRVNSDYQDQLMRALTDIVERQTSPFLRSFAESLRDDAAARWNSVDSPNGRPARTPTPRRPKVGTPEYLQYRREMDARIEARRPELEALLREDH